MTKTPPNSGDRNRRRHREWFLAFMAAWVGSILTGCAVGQAVPTQPEDVSMAAGPMDGTHHLESVAADWWQELGSARLNALIAQALQSSPNLAATEATLRQADRMYAAQAGATQSPQVDARLGAQRQQTNAAASGMPDGDRLYNLYHVGVEVGYTFDLFGANRRFLEKLAAEVDYKRYQHDGARLALVGNVVTTAITQARLVARLKTSEAILADQEAKLAIWQRRLTLGAASPSEVLAWQTQVDRTRADVPALHAALAQNRHLLAVLVGQEPGSMDQVAPFQLSEFAAPVAPLEVLPVALARQRPDIKAAEAMLQSAYAQHGMAVAKFYPQITLSGSLGSQSLTMGSLFDGGSPIWGLAGQLTQPLFRRGLRAEAQAAAAGIDAAAGNYRQTVLEALRDVADVLQSLDADTRSLQSRRSAHHATQAHLQSVRRRHELGAASTLEVLTTRQLAHQVEYELHAAQAQHLLDSVALFQSLGGGILSEAETFAAN